MSFKAKRRLRIIGNSSVGWALAFVFLVIVRGIGTTEQGNIDFEVSTAMYISIFLGMIFGSFSGLMEIYSEERLYRQVPFYQMITARVLYFILFLSGIIVVSYWICRVFLGIEMGILEFAFDEGSFPVYFYMIVVSALFSVMAQLKRMIGESQFRKLITGKFYYPREEERIFMFLDLKSSTAIAEKLGHIRYSELIQDCFDDASIVTENAAEIYQYVGDEIVLTWEKEEGLKDENCIEAYFRFMEQINRKEEYYTGKYGLLPFFKAGVNVGMVTTTEVGKYKKEIAYHGDPINTAARVQELCNVFDSRLLISEDLKNSLSTDSGYQYKEQGELGLKGKEQKVRVFEVRKVEPVKL